jgi:beta-N-acetylhexosaminidase
VTILARFSVLAARLSTAAALLLLGVLDLCLPDSLLYPWNHGLAVAVIGAALLGGALELRARRHAMALLFAGLAAGALWQITYPLLDRHAVLGRTDAVSRDIERHFVVGYRDIATAQELVRDAGIGGVFLTQRNAAGRTSAAMAAEIAHLQALRRASGLPPLVVTADQEGGPVSHLSPPLPAPPALATLAGLPAPERAPAARRLGRAAGAGLRGIGVTMDLAPVCDLMPRGAAASLDLRTRLKTRSISADPAVTAQIAAAFAEGLAETGVTPTAKHFPGLSRVTADTHLFGASLLEGPASLAASDWVPFRAVMAVPGAALMLSHVALAGVDADIPVSRSRAVVDGLLRRQWHFDGIAITDDLTMGAVEHSGLCREVEGALNAGVDLLLVSWDIDKAYPAIRCALAARDAGRLDLAVLRESARRLDRLTAGPPARREEP